jgi:2-keto-4-pentenoate hydratase/2-oxohepta-3-ene-1,7-dioic acid hydratase in catechol pathway
MKIIRFLSDDNRVLCGRYATDKPDIADIIEGDIFQNFQVTRRQAKIKRFLPPVQPTNILALGLNYRRHAEETAMAIPDYPILFMKATGSAIGHQEPIQLPFAGPEKVDYEAELAVVIGTGAKNLKIHEAMSCVLGYTCANDVSARDWQLEKQKGQWIRGKSFDTFCPMGPWLVSRDELAHPDQLKIRAILNDNVILQDANTSDMIYNVSAIISFLSQSMTLLPGTVILTGTPEGVGFTRQPPLFLKAGDRITVEIESIGRLSNPVVREQPPAG